MTKESDNQIPSNEHLLELSKKYFFRHYHIANEGKRTVSYKIKLKRMGFRAGAPDLVVEYPKGNLIYIELKNESGRLSEAQKLWQIQSNALGTPHFVIKGNIRSCLTEISNIISKYVPSRQSMLDNNNYTRRRT